MDQIKIGKFIASVRRELNLTQLDLANKIGVTDRAVSKWENGRGLPEISLIKPLCEALFVSVNELLSGERIEEEHIIEKADTAIVDTLCFSQRKIKRARVLSVSISVGVLAVFMLLLSAFAIDINRMKNDKSVLFSTWGFDYAPPVDLKEEETMIAIRDYLVRHGDAEEKHNEDVKTFVAFKTYLVQEESNSKCTVYAWVLQKQLYMNNGKVEEYSAFSMPFTFTVEDLSVIDSRYPRDGSYYKDDMKILFPKSVSNKMDKVHTDGTYERLELEIQEQARLYFHLD